METSDLCVAFFLRRSILHMVLSSWAGLFGGSKIECKILAYISTYEHAKIFKS